MSSSPSAWPDRGLRRRALLGAAIWAPAVAAWAQAGDAEALLRAGGVVIAFRHALAPGTFDPPQFRLGDCSTQRNLSDDGRVQARRIGAWFRDRGLKPARVRSSPWCRCVDTAELAFGGAETWAALGSPRGADEVTNAESLRALREAVAAAPRGRFEAWVTHMFVLSALTGEGSSSGEGLVLRTEGDRMRVLARIRP
ncbi:MAG: histidine phosphatase family protein [Rubrivivax sp.]|nr:histidine phosphatase family protein [Rubrivivax sp.]